jgi:diaminopimelate epimerase
MRGETMSIHLPPPIDIYIKAENSGNVARLSACFAADATVRDESQSYESLAAIMEWKAETKKKYNHTVEPLKVEERDGKTVVEAKLTGDFPGSPVTVEFSFLLEGNMIVSLEIQ